MLLEEQRELWPAGCCEEGGLDLGISGLQDVLQVLQKMLGLKRRPGVGGPGRCFSMSEKVVVVVVGWGEVVLQANTSV